MVTQIIPRKLLFGNPDKASPQLSPDGRFLSYLAPVDSVLNVWVGPADNPAAAKPVTTDKGRGIRFYGWAYTNNHIGYIQDRDGDENWHLYHVDLTTGGTMDMTPLEGVQARMQEVSPKYPEEVLVLLNARNPQFHEIYRVNIYTGERELVQENDQFVDFVTDEDFNVRFAVRPTPDGGNELLSRAEDGGWEPFARIAMEDSIHTGPIGLDRAGRTLYMIDSRGRDTSALTAINLDTQEQTVIAEDARSDVSDTMLHPTEKTPQAAAFSHQRKEWRILDDSIAADLEYLGTVADGEIEVISRTLDDDFWIAAYLLDDGPVRYYRYDRTRKQAQFLFSNREALEGLPLAKVHPVVIKSRDGLDLVSYYMLPLDSDRDSPGHPANPLPMALLVHGGPWARDNWGYNPVYQLLANRGYAVLSVNFRGSTGFGKDFVNAANLEWAGKMHDDLVDAVQWAIEQNIADHQRVAILGGSYGGYATLAGLTFTPDTFACGVDIVGPSNLVTLLNTIPPYWEPQVELWANRVGDHRTEEGRAFLTE
jgi:dipeptidyl aminopeptidase/acylaminoacyl peptidase